MSVGLDVLAEGAGVRVALQAARHLAVVGLVHVVRARVLEAVAGVGVALAAALVRTDVGLLPWKKTIRYIERIKLEITEIQRLRGEYIDIEIKRLRRD